MEAMRKVVDKLIYDTEKAEEVARFLELALAVEDADYAFLDECIRGLLRPEKR